MKVRVKRSFFDSWNRSHQGIIIIIALLLIIILELAIGVIIALTTFIIDKGHNGKTPT
jgi:hypothetical protein